MAEHEPHFEKEPVREGMEREPISIADRIFSAASSLFTDQDTIYDHPAYGVRSLITCETVGTSRFPPAILHVEETRDPRDVRVMSITWMTTDKTTYAQIGRAQLVRRPGSLATSMNQFAYNTPLSFAHIRQFQILGHSALVGMDEVLSVPSEKMSYELAEQLYEHIAHTVRDPKLSEYSQDVLRQILKIRTPEAPIEEKAMAYRTLQREHGFSVVEFNLIFRQGETGKILEFLLHNPSRKKAYSARRR